jgi:hypothetical protein
MSVYSEPWYRDHVAKAEAMNREHVAKYERSFNGIMAADAADIAKADHNVSPHGLAAAVSEHFLDLLHHRRRHLGIEKGAQPAKDTTMSTSEHLDAIVKRFGPVPFAKHIVDTGKAPCSEHELVGALTKAASEQHPELTEAQAFAKLYENASVWQAIAIAKAMPFVADLTPLVVGGEDTRDLSDESEAIAQLKQLGARKWPTATEAQQFANAFSDPKNAALAAKAHRRPAPTTSFPFPR